MKNVILFVLISLLASKTAWSQSKKYEVYALKFASSAHLWPIADWVDKGPKDDSVQIDKNLAGKLTLVNGDNQEIISGIKVFTGSRHTFNSQYVLVETGTNKVILASDNIWVYYNLEHMQPAASGGTYDLAGYINAMQRMKTLVNNSRYIIPGHDGKIFSNFPVVKEGVVQIN